MTYRFHPGFAKAKSLAWAGAVFECNRLGPGFVLAAPRNQTELEGAVLEVARRSGFTSGHIWWAMMLAKSLVSFACF